jgi:Rrf2 family iron-sulfur cluster assembly transcriptional regulator
MEIDGPVKVSKIAEMQSIEITYLEQLFRKLRIAGLIDSTRGRNGGYFFAKDPTKISVKDIMIAVEEDLDATSCSGASDCNDGKKCRTHTLWASLNTVVVNYLEKITLDTLVESHDDHYINVVNLR